MMAKKRTGAGRVVVIGAGVGGLTAAAVLARAGVDVTVLEAHVYPGGCAGTFYHKGYRFDAGATLPGGFYTGGPMDLVAHAAGIARWPVEASADEGSADGGSAPVMAVHLPGGVTVLRYGDERRAAEHDRAFGAAGRRFWHWQEATADALWALALRNPPWPPQTTAETLRVGQEGLGWLLGDLRRLSPGLLADALRPVAAHLGDAPANLRTFVDAQLLIAAQTTSAGANALYGAAALDLPRRGVVHLTGGIGAIARTLAEAVVTAGGKVLYRHEVRRILVEGGRAIGVETRRGERFNAAQVIVNLPPPNIAALLGEAAPPHLRRLAAPPADGWGAFMVYVGLDGSALPRDFPLHHQVVVREPLGEGNSIFLSLSPGSDAGRGPAGRRALTVSTHTALPAWWSLHRDDPSCYAARKQRYVEQMLAAGERAIPHLREAADLVLPGTPVTFQRFTRRVEGWVGGYPQTGLLRAQPPRLLDGLWMVGDSIFPGQSTAAVALGGLRVGNAVLGRLE